MPGMSRYEHSGMCMRSGHVGVCGKERERSGLEVVVRVLVLCARAETRKGIHCAYPLHGGCVWPAERRREHGSVVGVSNGRIYVVGSLR